MKWPDSIAFEGEVWLWESPKASWHFVSVPKEQSEQIKFFSPQVGKGFGSVPVKVTIGATSWRTSVFPDSKSGCYILPLKKAVRTAEKIDVGSIIRVGLNGA